MERKKNHHLESHFFKIWYGHHVCFFLLVLLHSCCEVSYALNISTQSVLLSTSSKVDHVAFRPKHPKEILHHMHICISYKPSHISGSHLVCMSRDQSIYFVSTSSIVPTCLFFTKTVIMY